MNNTVMAAICNELFEPCISPHVLPRASEAVWLSLTCFPAQFSFSIMYAFELTEGTVQLG